MKQKSDMEIEIRTDGHGGQIAAIFLAIAICATVAHLSGFGRTQTEKKPATLTIADKKDAVQKIDPFSTIFIQAKAAYVWDVTKQKALYQKNADNILPLASITKVMTAVVASEQLEPTATISIKKEDIAQEGDSGLLLNERWTFKKLLDYTLAVSSNDGAYALASAASPNFIDKMNIKGKILGLSSMSFSNPTGLDESLSRSGGYGSASDVAKLFSYILQKNSEILNATKKAKFTVSSLDNLKHTAINTDEEVNNIPGIIGSKTGFSDLAGGNLAVAYDAAVNYPIVVVVLGSTYDGRFDDVTSLIQASNQALSLQK